MSVIPATQELKQEDCKIEACLGYIVSSGQPAQVSQTQSQNKNPKIRKSRPRSSVGEILLSTCNRGWVECSGNLLLIRPDLECSQYKIMQSI